MTVSSSIRRAGPFNGNGVATAFPFTFKVFAKTDVAVYLTDDEGNQELLTSNYTVTLNADQNASPGGTVNYPTSGDPLPDGYSLNMIGNLGYTQATRLTNAGRFLPNVIEDALDKVTILIQQVLERIGRVLTYPVGESTSTSTLPTAAQRADKFLAFDAEGNPIASIGTGADAGLRGDLASYAGTSTGAGLVRYRGSANYAASTLGATLNDVVFDVRAFPWLAAGDDETDDRAAIEAAIAAASAASADGMRRRVLIPAGYVFRCNNEIAIESSNVTLDVRGELKFYGGNAVGGFVVVRAASNIEITGGGTINANQQTNDNAIAVGFVNPDQSVAGPACEDIWIHHIKIKGCRHGGSHIPDPTDPSKVGTGGGKGITIQFGVKRAIVHNVEIDDCDIGFSVEGKEADSGYVSEIVFSDVIVRGSRYIGAMLGSVPNTTSLFGQVTGLTLNNVVFRDCANGQTLEAVPRNVAELFGVIVGQAMVDVSGDVKIVNTSGRTTLTRGSFRASGLKITAIVDDLQDAIASEPYEGHNPQNTASRYNEFDVKLTILGGTIGGYLLNSDATYGATLASYKFSVIWLNDGVATAVPTAKYANNLPATTTFMLKDQHSGRFVLTNDGASPTGTVAGIQTFINGLGFEDDSINNLSKLAATRGGLALANNSGTTQAIAESNQFTIKNRLGFDSSLVFIDWGAGSPEGVVTASPGAMYLNTAGGTGTTLYVKQTGSNTNTGWVAK